MLPDNKIAAQVLMPSDDNFHFAAKRLQQGKLVAFPTETVYGLGANALNENAVKNIFTAKGRPLTNPLIVHVASLEMANTLLQVDEEQQLLFSYLAACFWPGPLTIVAKAAAHIPKLLMAGGEYIGIRYPKHPIAIELISRANLPLAGPSANRSSHVSPTCAKHVMDDLGHTDLTILDGGECQVGIESTVVKINHDGHLYMLRRGAITPKMIEDVLEKSPCRQRVIRITDSHINSDVALQAPGQLLTHYAPTLPAYILSKQYFENKPCVTASSFSLAGCAVIDFCDTWSKLANHTASYIDLSKTGNAHEAAAKLFTVLRSIEKMPDITAILLPDLSHTNDDDLRTIFDRIYRAASGQFIYINRDHALLFENQVDKKSTFTVSGHNTPELLSL